MGMVLGGAAYSAFKKLSDTVKNNSENIKKVAPQAKEIKDTAKKGAIAGGVAGTIIAGPLGTIPGAAAGAATSTAVGVAKKVINK